MLANSLRAALVASLCFLGVGLPACAWLQAHPGIVACATSALTQGTIAAIATALSGSAPDWTSLGKLESQFGVDAVACEVKSLIASYSAPGAAKSAVAARVVANGRAYLKARGLE